MAKVYLASVWISYWADQNEKSCFAFFLEFIQNPANYIFFCQKKNVEGRLRKYVLY